MQPILQNITHIGIVTGNIREMVEQYRSYGITEWSFFDGMSGSDPATKVRNLHVHGQKRAFRISLATAMVGNVEIKLIEPLDENSDFAMFLREHGEGIHHIAVTANTEDYHRMMKIRDIPVLMQGTVTGVGTFTYYDTWADLGFMTEILDPQACERGA